MRRFLYVTSAPPYPPVTGDFQRTNLLLRALRSLGEVDMLLLRARESLPEKSIAVMKKEFGLAACIPAARPGMHAPWSAVRGLSPRAVDALAFRVGGPRMIYTPTQAAEAWVAESLKTRRYDLAVGRYLLPTVQSGVLGLLPTYLDLDDIDPDVYRMRSENEELGGFQRASFRSYSERLESLMPELLARCAAVSVCSEADRKKVVHPRLSVIQNIAYRAEGAPVSKPLPAAAGDALLIVASFDYLFNVWGLERFLSGIWPRVRAERPAAVLRVVGGGINEDQRSRWAAVPGVEVVGFAADLNAEYARCAFTIVPLFQGTGSNIKILEALSLGRTCVVASRARNGFAPWLRHEDSLLAADDDAAFSRACVALLEDPSLREKLAARGAAVAAEQFNYEKFERTVAHAVESALVAGGKA